MAEMEYKIAGPGSTLICDWDETLGRSFASPNFLGEYYSNPEIYRRLHPIGEEPICYSTNLVYDGPVAGFDPKTQLIYWGLFRPHAIEFLNFCHARFENTIIWSAGIEPYVEEICRELLRTHGVCHPRIIFSRNNCKFDGTYYHKPITLLMSTLAQSGIPINIDPKKTLIVDDKEFTFAENPANGILIPPFKPEPSNALDRSDRCLKKLMTWMDSGVLRAPDYRYLDKQGIFK